MYEVVGRDKSAYGVSVGILDMTLEVAESSTYNLSVDVWVLSVVPIENSLKPIPMPADTNVA